MNLKQISLISILTTGLSFGLNAASALPGDISGLVDSAAPAVVNITSKKEVKMRDNRRGFDEFERFFGIPTLKMDGAEASGLYIATEASVTSQ
jgi:S1-C subfamily serine protease